MPNGTESRVRTIEGVLSGIEDHAIDPAEVDAAIERVCEKAEDYRWDDFMSGGAAVLAFKNSLRKELEIE